jgi:hypothetical protein
MIVCPPRLILGTRLPITFSASRENGILTGTFAILNFTGPTTLKSGSITGGDIQSGTYTLQGTETVDT